MPALVDNKEIIRRFADELINEAKYDTAEELLAENIADHTPLGETTGRESVVDTLKTVRTAFPDFAITLQAIVSEHDTVAVRMTQRGTH